REAMREGGSTPSRIREVRRVLGDVHVDPDVGARREIAERVQRVVIEREWRVRADERAMRRALAHAREESLVLAEPRIPRLSPIAIARLVAERSANPDGIERLGDRIERPIDGVRRRVMVDHRGAPSLRRLDRADLRRNRDVLEGERLVEAPPNALEDLWEIL